MCDNQIHSIVVDADLQTEVDSADNPVSTSIDNNADLLISKETEHMQQFYKSERYKSTRSDDWPPYQPDHFTSVALIHHKEKLTTKKEVIAVATQSHKGKIEVGVSHNNSAQNTRQFTNSTDQQELPEEYFKTCHSTKNVTQIFDYASLQSLQMHSRFSTASNFILIEGAPGIGKTILSKEIAFQWANKNLLTDKMMLFLIFLRDPELKNIASLKDFIAYNLGASKESKSVQLVTEYLEENSGSCLTIVFDGYDEISDEIRHKSFVTKVINRKILKLCGLVITSRPTASMDLRKDCDCRIEILGFTEEDRIEYIKQCFRGEDDKCTQLKVYLEKHSFINSLCYIPLNMTILICLFKNFFKNESYILPKSQTEINEHFICITIERFLKRKRDVVLTTTSLEMLPAPYKQQLRNLSELAFDLLGKDRIVFNNDDIKRYKTWSNLGLIKTVKFNYQTDASFNFLHFSLQEFLAAYYVTSLYTWNQVTLLRDNFWDSRYLNMWVMYVGLTKGVSFAFRHFLTRRSYILISLIFRPNYIANELIRDKVKCLHLFQCFSELGDDKICQQVGKCFVDENIDLSNSTLLPRDMHTLCLFFTRSAVLQWKLLDLSNCYIGDNCCKMLVDLLQDNGKSKVKITEINLSNNRLTSACILAILKLVQYFDVKELTVKDNGLDNEMFLEAFFTSFIQQQLVQEILVSIKMNKKQLSIFAFNYKSLLNSKVKRDFQMNNIINLCLSNTNCNLEGLSELLKSAHPGATIQLHIYYNEDSDDIINHIHSKLHNTLKIDDKTSVLQISYALISPIKMLIYNMNECQITESLKSILKPSILTLHLNSCVLSTISLHNIGNILSIKFKELQILDISGCNIQDIQLEEFCKALCSRESLINHLKEFNLSNNCLTSVSTSYIIHLLQRCTINQLILSNNKIDIDNFNAMFFKSRYDAYCNFGSKIPLIVVNNFVNDERAKSQDAQCLEHMNFTVCVIFTPLSEDLCNVMTTHNDHHVWIFLINTNVTIEHLNKIIQLSLANNNIRKITIIEDLQHFQMNNIINLCLSNTNCNLENLSELLKSVHPGARIQLHIYHNEDSDDIINHIHSKLHNTLKIDDKTSVLQISYTLISQIKILVYNMNECLITESLKSILKPPILALCLNSCVLSTMSLHNIGNILSIKFKELQILDISGCNIQDIQFKEFCKALCSRESLINHLKEFNLSNNCLTSVSTGHIIHLLQRCTINQLILSNNKIDIDNFNTMYFESRYYAYCNFGSKIPLIVINNIINDERAKSQDAQWLEHMNVKICFIFTPLSEDLCNIMTTHNDHHVWIFLINTNVTIDHLNKIIQLSLANNNIRKITIIKDLQRCQMNNIINLYLSNTNFNLESLSELLKSVHPGARIQLHIYHNEDSDDIINHIHSKLHNTLKIDDKTSVLQISHILISETKMLVYNMNEYQITESLKSILKPSILTLHINSCVLSTTSLHNIGNILSIKFKELQILDISGCNIQDIQLEEFCKALCSRESLINHLKEFNLSNNCLTSVSTSYIIHLLQRCTINQLILSNNKIDIDNFNAMFFKSRYDTYCNFGSKIPLIVVNNFVNDERAMSQDTQCLEHMNSTICFIFTPLSEDLCNVMTTHNDHHVWIFLINTNVTIEHLNKIIQSSLCSNNIRKITIIEEHLAYYVANEMIIHLKNCRYYKNRVLIPYCYQLHWDNILASNIMEIINVHTVSEGFLNHYFLVSSFLSLDYFNHRHWDLIDLSHCNIGDSGLTMFLDCFKYINTISFLNLSSNNLSSHSTDNIAMLIVYSKLKILFVSDNEVEENHIADAVCKLQSEASETASPVILVLKNHHLALIINNMFVFGSQMLTNRESYTKHVTSLMNLIYDYYTVNHTPLFQPMDRLNTVSLRFWQGLKLNLNVNVGKKKLTVHLNVKNCCIILEAATDLEHLMLKHKGELTHLTLSHCKFPEDGLCHMLTILRHTTSLLVLRFSYIFIFDFIASAISTILCRLEELDLTECSLHRNEWTKLLTALTELSSLKFLTLSHLKIHNSMNHSDEQGPSITHDQNVLLTSTISKNQMLEPLTVEINSPLLEYLNLANCEISEQLISIFRTLSKPSLLKFLDMSHNKVTRKTTNEIAQVIENTKSLQYLHLSTCNLSEDSMKLVADSLSYVTSLVSLDLSCNRITENAAHSMAVALRKNLALKQLNFSTCFVGNAALTICDAISQHTTITHLNMSLNVITNDVAKVIARILSNNTDIIHVDFCQCCLQDSGLAILLSGLANVTTLQYLNLEANNISKDLIPKISSLICNNSTLKHINLSNCSLSEVEMQDILQKIGKLHLIEYLKISDNKINCISLKEVLSNNNRIKHLDCSNSKIRVKETCDILISLNTFTLLKSLNLQSCYFNDMSASLLSEVIIQNKSLQYLNLTHCNLQSKGLITISKALQEISMVKHLSLNSNHITNVASLEIASAVNKNSELQYLALSNCGLQETGLINISEALCKISSLKHLDLSHNSITDKAATTIASATANNQRIQRLDFSFCTWQENGITTIHQMINKLPEIKEVDFHLHNL